MSGCWTSHKIRGKGFLFLCNFGEKGLSCLCAILGKKDCRAFGQFWAKRLFCFCAILGERLLFCEEGLVRKRKRKRKRGGGGGLLLCLLDCVICLCCVVVLGCLFCGLQLQCRDHHHGSRE